MIYNNILETIGNTPLVKINRAIGDCKATVYCKLECFNPGQSAKDRVARYMLQSAEEKGLINPGATIIEATSGNTGLSLAMACRIKGYRCMLTITDKSSNAKIDLLKSMGADVIICPAKVKPEDPRSYYSRAKRLAAEIPNSYYVNQNFNLDNSESHYRTTGPEIWNDTKGKVTHLIVCAGTGGTISGTARYLKEQNPDIQIIGVDADGSVLMHYHKTGEFDKTKIKPYKIEGLGKTIMPKNVDFASIDRFIKVNDKDSAIAARSLAEKEAILVGYSSGAAFQALLQIKDELNKDDIVVVVCPDHGSKYLDKIYNESWMIEYGYNQEPEQIVQNKNEDILARKPGSLWKANQSGKFKVIRSRELNNHNQSGMDLFEKIKNNPGPLGQYAEQAEGYFIFPNLEGELGSRMQFRGQEVIVWSVNNYLGLGNHPEVREADAKAAEKWGLAYPMGSRMMSGNSTMHDQLENELAEFVQKPAAVLVNFGYQGIMSAVDCLTDRRDVIVYDAGCHACIIDGVRMNMGKRFAFEHNDVESLERCLKRAEKIVQSTGGAILVISEGVFGMRGEQGILKEIIELKSKYQFRVLVDDAHGFGTLGEGGRGAGVEQGVQDEIDIYFSTFAKSMASVGAFLASTPEVTRFLKYNMRSQIFAKSLPMPIVEGALKRLDMLRKDPGMKDKLWENANMLQDGLRGRGFDLGNTNSCVTPVYMHGSVTEATQLVYELREIHRIFCSIVVYPVIPKGLILLRLIPTTSHTKEDIDATLEAFTAIKTKLDSGAYKVDNIVQVAQ